MSIKQYLPKKAQEIITTNSDAVLIDVRSYAENKFVGRPLNCLFVPWVDEPDWEPKESEFVEGVKRSIGDSLKGLDTEIILICRSGFRSHDAGMCLIDHGFTNVSHVVSGFEGDLDENDQRGNVNGWRHDGMPWSQC